MAAASEEASAAFCDWRRVSRASPRSTTIAAHPTSRVTAVRANITATSPSSSRALRARRATSPVSAGPRTPAGSESATVPPVGSGVASCSMDICVLEVIHPPSGIGSSPMPPSDLTMAHTVSGAVFFHPSAVRSP